MRRSAKADREVSERGPRNDARPGGRAPTGKASWEPTTNLASIPVKSPVPTVATRGGSVIQGSFLLSIDNQIHPGPIAIEYILQVLGERGQQQLAIRLGIAEQELGRYLRKIAEGPVLFLFFDQRGRFSLGPSRGKQDASREPARIPDEFQWDSDQMLEAVFGAIAIRAPRDLKLKGAKEATTDLDSRSWLKVNRIAGLIEKKFIICSNSPMFGRELAPYYERLTRLLLLLTGEPLSKNALQGMKLGYELLVEFHRHALKEPRHVWMAFSTLSEFGPLGHWTCRRFRESGDRDELNAVHQTNLMVLREIRQALAKAPGPTVVAHRGTGPTNRTMGALIGEDENRRTNRPAENSHEAFNSAAWFAVQHAQNFGGLDGVECDVYLSQDQVPILSHESHVAEQIQRGTKNAIEVPEGVKIGDATAELLKTIRRKPDNSASGFVALPDFLFRLQYVAFSYYHATGKPFRVEIEMKGIAKDHKGEHPLEQSVASCVSKFRKSFTLTPIEIIMFHGSAEQVDRFSTLRTEKTAMSALYTGVNSDSMKVNPMTVDELRYGIKTHISYKSKQAPQTDGLDKRLEHFIVTLVHDQEFLPSEMVRKYGELRAIEPSVGVKMRYGYKNQVEESLERRQNQEPTYDDQIIEALRAWYRSLEDKNTKLHILTDYPQKAAFLKQRIRE